MREGVYAGVFGEVVVKGSRGRWRERGGMFGRANAYVQLVTGRLSVESRRGRQWE